MCRVSTVPASLASTLETRHELSAKLRIFGVLGTHRHQLHGDLAPRGHVHRKMHGGHAFFAKELDDSVLPADERSRLDVPPADGRSPEGLA